MEINQEEIQTAIIEKAVNHILDEYDFYQTINRKIDSKIDEIFSKTVDEQLTKAIDETITNGFEREFHRIDEFGRPKGEPTTISKEMAKLTTNYWQQKVDRNGKPTSDSYNSTTRAEYVMCRVCGDDFRKNIEQEVVNVTGQLKDGLRTELRGWLDTTLGKVFSVRSAQDQAEGRYS